jgi:hypothetical protein
MRKGAWKNIIAKLRTIKHNSLVFQDIKGVTKVYETSILLILPFMTNIDNAEKVDLDSIL